MILSFGHSTRLDFCQADDGGFNRHSNDPLIMATGLENAAWTFQNQGANTKNANTNARKRPGNAQDAPVWRPPAKFELPQLMEQMAAGV